MTKISIPKLDKSSTNSKDNVIVIPRNMVQNDLKNKDVSIIWLEL